MKIAFYGSSLLSAYWNGAATYYRGLLKTLARRHQICFFEPDAFDRQAHRDIEPPSWAEVQVYEATQDGLTRALAAGRDADLVVKASGVGVFDDELVTGVLDNRQPETKVIFWDVDAPATLASLKADRDQVLARRIGEFDAVFTYGGGERVQTLYRRLGARRCTSIFNALDPDTHYPVPPEPALAADLLFLGNRLPDREARVQRYFLDVAAAAPDLSFLLGGSGWEEKTVPVNVRRLGHVPTAQHNLLNASVRAVLNISRDDMANLGFAPATRVFEAAGAGACLITDHWPGIEMFLQPEREILVAKDGGAVLGHLRQLNPVNARRIGARARTRLLQSHTYRQRALEVEAALAGLQRPADARQGKAMS